jgi:hypothetical protein
MTIDWNNIVKRIFDLLEKVILIYKPSLARLLIAPTLLGGIAILNPPWWLDLLNWVVTNQNYIDEYKKAISESDPLIGWGLLGYSLLVFILESLRMLVEKRISDSNSIPERTAELVRKEIFALSTSAPHIIDEKINKRINELQNLRFFNTFPKEEKSILLANDIIEGELSGGSYPVKALGLALSARYLSAGENIDKAKIYLEKAKVLAVVPETNIAEAFIKAAESSIDDGILLLANNGTTTYHSAIFMLKKSREGSRTAISWLSNAGLSVLNLDVDGKISYISALLEMHEWVLALDVVCSLNFKKPITSPGLAQVSAFTFLTNAIKVVELRESVMQQLPFAAEEFPLADDTESINLRTKAVTLFELCSELASDLGSTEVAKESKKYALWLELRNPDTCESAKNKLQKIATNYSIEELEYLPLVFAFRVNVDYQKIEDEVNRQTILCNDTNPTLGVARFVLALNQKGYPKAIEYISSHRKQLEKFVNCTTVNMFEVEALAKAGLTDDAEVLLSKLDESGAIPGVVRNLRNIIASVKGEDPIALAINQYNETKNVSDLAQLVNLLERSELKEKYRSSALELFTITGTETDALKVANATSNVGGFSELHTF